MSYNVSVRKYFVVVSILSGIVAFQQCKPVSGEGGSSHDAIRVLMVGGGTSHDFERWYKEVDAQTLERDNFAVVRYTSEPDSIDDYLSDTDVLVLVNNQPVDDPAVRKAIFEFVSAGHGLVLGHAALWYNWADWPEYNKQLVGGGSTSHDRYGSFEVIIAEPDHPIMEGVPARFSLKDELYHFIPDSTGTPITVLARSSAGDPDHSYPSVFVVNQNRGRIVCVALGHDGAAHELPAYQHLLRNAVGWAGGPPEALR